MTSTLALALLSLPTEPTSNAHQKKREYKNVLFSLLGPNIHFCAYDFI